MKTISRYSTGSEAINRESLVTSGHSAPGPVIDKDDLALVGFALADCEIEIDRAAAKYLKAVHRTALELATPNCFGVEIGGFWLMQEQITQLRRLPSFYAPLEASLVARAVEAYIKAQLPTLDA